MALPYSLLTMSGLPGYHPPFKSSAGAFYVVMKTAASTMGVLKATDPETSWLIKDIPGQPSFGNDAISVAQNGDVLHIATINSAGGFKYEYHTFNMATDLWVVTDEEIDAPTSDPTFPWISIAVRSSGDAVVVYAGAPASSKERVFVNVRNGSWGGAVALDAGGSDHYGNPNCVLGTNDFVHCIWQRTANAANPPTAWTNTQGRSVDPADDSLSTVDSSTADSGTVLLGYSNIVTYDDAGTQRMVVSGWNNSTDLETAQATEDGNDEIVLTVSGQTQDLSSEEPYVNGEVGILTFAALDADIYGLYSGDGSSGADQDLWYMKSTNNGTFWVGPTEEIDAITVNYISANIYVRNGATVMAYLYNDGGVQKYNEKVLIEAVPIITDVDGDETWDDGATGLVITGSNFL